MCAVKLGLLAGVVAVLVGGVVLTGWAIDLVALKSVLPGWVSMKPNAALAFILTGIALLLSRLPFLSSNLNTSRVGSGPAMQPDGGSP